jgi:hypothetical protein
MDNIPVHMRITGLTVLDGDVDARRLAVSDLQTRWTKLKAIDRIIAKAGEIAAALGGNGTPPTSLADEIQQAVQNHASAFLHSERPLEVGVCAGMAFVALAKPEPIVADWTVIDLMANALWSALAFQPALQDQKRENLRCEVLAAAQDRSTTAAEKARERSPVSDIADLVVTIADDNKVTTNFKKAMVGTIEALRRNALLDREELDFMWWAQLGRSRVLGRPLAEIPEPIRLVHLAGSLNPFWSTHAVRGFPFMVHRNGFAMVALK